MVQPYDLTSWSHITIPALGYSRLNGNAAFNLRGQHLVSVTLGLLLKAFPGGHAHHTNGNALFLECDPGLQGRMDLATGG